MSMGCDRPLITLSFGFLIFLFVYFVNHTEYGFNRIYYFALFQLQDAGCWNDAATLAASHLHGSDYARYGKSWQVIVCQERPKVVPKFYLF
jgi:hypothetical protein